MVNLGEGDLWPMMMAEVSYRKAALETIAMCKVLES